MLGKNTSEKRNHNAAFLEGLNQKCCPGRKNLTNETNHAQYCNLRYSYGTNQTVPFYM
jgi:hypothetical protein